MTTVQAGASSGAPSPVQAWMCLFGGTAKCVTALRPGKAPARCPGCKGSVMTSEVHLTVQQWRGDGRYTLEGALRVFRSLPAAERHAAAAGDDTVVRLVLG